MRELLVCPHCGRTNATYRNVRAYGWCEEHFDEYGNQWSIETDHLRFTKSQTFYCATCGKKRSDIIETNEGVCTRNNCPTNADISDKERG